MKSKFDWKLAVFIGVAFVAVYPIQQTLMFGTDSLLSVLLATGLTAAISVGIAYLAHRLLFGRKNSN